MASFERTTWRVLLLLIVALGINKQLDLQTAFTEVGRMVAHHQGWYENRAVVQRLFILVLAVCTIGTSLALLHIGRVMPASTRLALVGAVLLLAFVLVRASSFHHVDVFLGLRFLGLRANWILEVGGIGIVGGGALLRSRGGGGSRF